MSKPMEFLGVCSKCFCKGVFYRACYKGFLRCFGRFEFEVLRGGCRSVFVVRPVGGVRVFVRDFGLQVCKKVYHICIRFSMRTSSLGT